MHEMLNDVFRGSYLMMIRSMSSLNGDASKCYGYMEDANQKMYTSCKLRKLSTIVHLFHIKWLQQK